ncbi:MAG: HEAT repeat domain-containing protein [Planctomycetes bacterium]|nr:HEAT repeat domain-containing protein [Planctomycetota bacterium]MCP4860407.1 HEAT repeat domain-containing protein [Planctomycetota bacterium]
MIVRLLTFCLILLALTPAVSAQGSRLDLPPPPPKQEEGQDDPKAGEQEAESEQPAEGEQEVPALWSDANGPIEELFKRFEMEQDGSKSTRAKYLEELRGLGLGSQDTALKALSSNYAPTVMLAAEILEWVGEAKDADRLVEAASSVNNVEAVGVCLDSALRLANGVLPEAAVRLLGHPKRQMRTVAEARLSERPNLSHLPKLLQFLNYGRDNDVRLRAARLLSAFPSNPDARLGLRQALAGDSIDVAMLSVRSLAAEGSDANIQWLHDELLSASTEMESAYLLMGILLHQDKRSDLIVAADLEERLRHLLRNDNPFISGTAAAALAEYVFRAELAGPIDDLERGVPQVLVRAVGGVDFYPQYARFAPLAERSLRRISGVHFEEQAGSAWVTWLADNHQGFHFVRGRIELAEGEAANLRVTWIGADSVKHTLVGSRASRLTGDRVVGKQGSEQLLAMIQKPGLLSASMMPGTMGLADAPLTLQIDISVGSRRKSLNFRGSAGAPWVDTLSHGLFDLYETTGWQALAGTDAAGRDFLDQNLERFDANDFANEEERTATLIALSTGRLAGLSESVLRTWVTELQTISKRSAYWTPELSREFLGLIPLYAQDGPFSASLVNMVMSDSTHAIDAEALELFATLGEPSRSDLLLRALLQTDADACGVLLADERLAVRLAAVRALPSFDAQGTSYLISALDDLHPLIQRTALHGLGSQRATIARDIVAVYTKEGMPVELRRAAIIALGQIGSPESLPGLVEISRSNDISLQLTAVNAIAEIPGVEADSAIGGLFPSFAATPVEGSYMRALMTRGSGSARTILRPYLISENMALSQRAALLAGSLGDPVAAPVLMDWLPREPRNPELLLALANSLCVDFRGTPDPAGTYKAWWADNQNRTSAEWLRNAATDSGFEIPRGFDDPTRVDPKKTVGALLTVLESGPAHMRAVTCYFLNTLTGVDAAVIAIGTPRPELMRRAQPWRDWLDS